jgi:hypothetical protein
MTSPSTRFFAHPKPINPTVFATDSSPLTTGASVPKTIAYPLHLIAYWASVNDMHHAVRVYKVPEQI